MIRRHLFELLAATLLLGGFGFLFECVSFLGRRDYVAGALLGGIGVAVLHVGVELARLALVERT
jgi:hypothetical protein